MIDRTELLTGVVNSTTVASTDSTYIDTTVIPGHDYTYQ